ncbi:uncharacterized protein LOC143029532 [Oratosquilla oratoria]|uniref:uncharacterized protein LOC143029532 n=1 Tax=Oratosquilla oratoria TaxID=337810 RepID=UPI003F76BC4C
MDITLCTGCAPTPGDVNKRCYKDNKSSLQFLREHGVLPSTVNCPRCNNCAGSMRIGICGHEDTVRELQFSRTTSTDWQSFCSEVCEEWYNHQEPIGGPGIVVEIDETLISRRHANVGRILSQVWMQGSVIISGCWSVYHNLGDFGYIQLAVNHYQNFVMPGDHKVHTQNIKRLWCDVKEWVLRPGIRLRYFRQYIARYIFLKECYEAEIHAFLQAARTLYNPQSERVVEKPANVSHDDNDKDNLDDI